MTEDLRGKLIWKLHQSPLWNSIQSLLNTTAYRRCILDWPHFLKKTSCMQSRYHNPHSKWPYHERNDYIFLLKCYLPGWITIIYFTTYNICLFGLCTRRKYMNANRAVINTLHHRNVFLIYCLSDKTIHWATCSTTWCFKHIAHFYERLKAK